MLKAGENLDGRPIKVDVAEARKNNGDRPQRGGYGGSQGGYGGS